MAFVVAGARFEARECAAGFFAEDFALLPALVFAPALALALDAPFDFDFAFDFAFDWAFDWAFAWAFDFAANFAGVRFFAFAVFLVAAAGFFFDVAFAPGLFRFVAIE